MPVSVRLVVFMADDRAGGSKYRDTADEIRKNRPGKLFESLRLFNQFACLYF